MHFTALHCTPLRCTALYYTTLHCTSLPFTVVQCTELQVTTSAAGGLVSAREFVVLSQVSTAHNARQYTAQHTVHCDVFKSAFYTDHKYVNILSIAVLSQQNELFLKSLLQITTLLQSGWMGNTFLLAGKGIPNFTSQSKGVVSAQIGGDDHVNILQHINRIRIKYC